MTDVLMTLREQLAYTRYADRPRLARELDRAFSRRTPGPAQAASIAKLQQAIETSVAQVERLRSLPLRLEFDPALPISAHHDEITTALQKHQLIVVCGATGSGKTTQLPKMCIAAGRGAAGLIGHTQPRRIAARAIANRLAQEMGTNVGGAVGYQVRFADHTGPDCRVKLMTDGILLRELERDRLLRRYDTLIIDEAHERSLNIDFLLGVLKRMAPQRPDLRVIITSATIDPQRFAEFFGGAPIIEVSGRTYPVEVRYRPLAGEEDEDELSLNEGIVAAVHELDRDQRGDVLVFLPGEKQIRDAADTLGRARFHHTDVVPLYARLSSRDQQRVFEPHGPRRIVLATNVAETSLTVPGIRHVVDSGLARISRYSVRGKVQRLPIEPISQASADQRKGRAGREQAGVCIRLYAEDDFDARPQFTPPEVLRTNLASVILQMAALDLGEPQDFPFLDPPDTRLINDGYRLLQELKAVDDSRGVTSLGKQISTLPLDPRLARMLLAASHHSCLAEMLIIAAYLAAQDPRERPSDAQQQADQKHAAFGDPRSDFVAILNLWNAFRAQSAALSGSQLRKWHRENFLSFMRMREWQELHRQLSRTLVELKLRANSEPAEYADLHQAILTGFLGNIGVLEERREYEGARGSRFVIAPGTPLASKPPKWIVAAQLTETTRLYARTAAAVEPHWIESAGAHLIKRSYSEPHWVEERGMVAAFESTALYGLTLSARRRVNFGAVDPRAAREIFVHEALVEGRTRFRHAFLDHNRRLRSEVEALESKVRRRDILADEQSLADFYLARLPVDVHSVSGLVRFLKGPAPAHQRDHRRLVAGGESPVDQLRMSHRDLMRRDAPEVTAESHPDTWDFEGNALPVQYRFEPGASDDGATITLPIPLLSAATPGAFSGTIPGWRIDKITEVLRALPKSIRKSFVPVPDFAARAAAEIDPHSEFNAAVAQWISRTGGVAISAEEVAALPIAAHLRFNLRIVDLKGAAVAEGRDLIELKRTVRHKEGGAVRARAPSDVHRRWDFGALPQQQSVERRGLRFTVYPTLRDRGDGVEVREAATEEEADASLRAGVLRLAMLTLAEQHKYARKRFADERDLVLLGQGLNNARALPDALAERTFIDCFLKDLDSLPRTGEAFQSLLDQRRAAFGETADRVLAHSTHILRELRSVRQKLSALSAPAFRSVQQDVAAQLERIIPADFPASVPMALWPHLPRFLKALVRRLDKVAGNQQRDAELMSKITPAVRAYEQIKAQSMRAGSHRELERLQWMIEELRVSLFAQDLRTAIPVSEKRVAEQVERARDEARR